MKSNSETAALDRWTSEGGSADAETRSQTTAIEDKRNGFAPIGRQGPMTTRIMVINNSDDILALFRKILATDNCEVFTQLFLNSDLREVRRLKPDLIILDYYVGREGVGWEFLQLLKMEDTTAQVPVLICTTAIKLVQEIAAYLATKQVTVLRKPFESYDLVRAVQVALQDKTGSTSLSTQISKDGSVSP
jgi:CheY-like chemotaxis protein